MVSAPSEILYARHEHGLHQIRVVQQPKAGVRGEFEILSLGGMVQARYTSTRHLLAALTGTPRPTMSFDQYFGRWQDHPSARLPIGGSTLDMFAVAKPVATPQRTSARRVPPVLPLTAAQASGLGIDLEKRGHEVRKLFFAGFGARIARHGYDAEEVLQEIYRGILARNRGKCPFDVKKSSFGHYVHMVCECIINNYHRRESRRREVEQVGLIAPTSMQDDAGATGTVDAASVAERTLVSTSDPNGYDNGMRDAMRRLNIHVERKRSTGAGIDTLAVQIAGLLVAGKNRREIADDLGVSPTRVTHAIFALREHVADWA